MRPSEASSSPAADCSGQNSHHSLLATTTASRAHPDARNSSPKTTSDQPVGIGARPVSSSYRASSRKSIPASRAARMTATPSERGMRSNVRHDPSATRETAIPERPSGACGNGRGIAANPTRGRGAGPRSCAGT